MKVAKGLHEGMKGQSLPKNEGVCVDGNVVGWGFVSSVTAGQDDQIKIIGVYPCVVEHLHGNPGLDFLQFDICHHPRKATGRGHPITASFGRANP